MGRGAITGRVSEASKAFYGRPIAQDELRLLPYIQYEMVNSRKLDPNKISPREREIMSFWREKGWIEGGASGLYISKPFWDFICEMLWIAYVDYDNDGAVEDTGSTLEEEADADLG